MAKSKRTMTDELRKTIRDSGMSLYAIEQEIGVQRASLMRFMRGDQSLRLDIADKLAIYLGLELTKRKDK